MARLSLTRTLLFMLVVSFLATLYIMMSYNNCDCHSNTDKLPVPANYKKGELSRNDEDAEIPNILNMGEFDIDINNNNNNIHDVIQHSKNYKEDDHDNDDDEGGDDDADRYDLEKNPHRLGILVPFRDRLEEFQEFVPYMQEFLVQQNVRYKIYVIHQADEHRFNRASLLNIGFLHSKLDCDYIVMHDIDLLPANPDLKYTYDMVAKGPHHISSPELHPKYHYRTFVGGVLMMKNEDFELANGLSNKYWGWGREDDEFYVRMKEANLQITYPQDIDTGYESFRHIHSSKRERDKKRYYNQKEESRRRDRITGLDTVRYDLASKHELHVDGAPVTMINVMLNCDKNVTPWCDVPPPPP